MKKIGTIFRADFYIIVAIIKNNFYILPTIIIIKPMINRLFRIIQFENTITKWLLAGVIQ